MFTGRVFEAFEHIAISREIQVFDLAHQHRYQYWTSCSATEAF